MLSLIPSEKLKGLLQQARNSYENTGALIMACYIQATSEGFGKWQARSLIISQVGLSDHQVRNYLPVEAKDMRFNRAKPKTAEVTSADITRSAAEPTTDTRLAVSKEWHEQISRCISNGRGFNLVIRNGSVVAVEDVIIPHDGGRYACEAD
jgi:hypothetical protein